MNKEELKKIVEQKIIEHNEKMFELIKNGSITNETEDMKYQKEFNDELIKFIKENTDTQ